MNKTVSNILLKSPFTVLYHGTSLPTASRPKLRVVSRKYVAAGIVLQIWHRCLVFKILQCHLILCSVHLPLCISFLFLPPTLPHGLGKAWPPLQITKDRSASESHVRKKNRNQALQRWPWPNTKYIQGEKERKGRVSECVRHLRTCWLD